MQETYKVQNLLKRELKSVELGGRTGQKAMAGVATAAEFGGEDKEFVFYTSFDEKTMKMIKTYDKY
ncbi:hypothetical protein L484_013072 [Morus notabilis]|uniref:Uncharacterized protein n=1 Tax=Morus notabilis TaxID=981085 RepID=W9RM90_9ROSA|nr:hypothetical protein L484_013072 [Morus notabilis]